MRGVIKWSILGGFILLLPFGYLFYRDIFASSDVHSLSSCTPYNIEWERSDSSLDLSWKTREECLGYVRYGTDSKSLTGIAADIDGSSKKKSHNVELRNVMNKTDYYVVFYSGDNTYGQSDQPLLIRID